MCVDTIMPTKCFTKATKQGKKYTACVDTKTFKKKGVKGNAKSKKPTAKGVMVVRKKIKTTRKLKNKSTITPPLTQSRRRPDGYKQEGQKKMSAGMSVLMTSGLMSRIGKAVITKKEKERRIKVEETKRKRKISRNIRLAENIYFENFARDPLHRIPPKIIKQLKKRRDNIRGKEYKGASVGGSRMPKEFGNSIVSDDDNLGIQMGVLLAQIKQDQQRKAEGYYR